MLELFHLFLMNEDFNYRLYHYNKGFFHQLLWWLSHKVDGLFRQAGDQSHRPSVHWKEDPCKAQNPRPTQRTFIHLENHPLICLHHFI